MIIIIILNMRRKLKYLDRIKDYMIWTWAQGLRYLFI